MILDHLANAARYEALGERFAAGLRWLAAFDPSTPDGRYPIEGAEVFAIVESYDTSPATERKFESHRLHADIQYVAAGRERILHARTEGLAVEVPYDEEKDIAFHADPEASTSALLRPGDFAILLPDDAHKPRCMAGGRDAVKKVVVKVRV